MSSDILHFANLLINPSKTQGKWYFIHNISLYHRASLLSKNLKHINQPHTDVRSCYFQQNVLMVFVLLSIWNKNVIWHHTAATLFCDPVSQETLTALSTMRQVMDHISKTYLDSWKLRPTNASSSIDIIIRAQKHCHTDVRGKWGHLE